MNVPSFQSVLLLLLQLAAVAVAVTRSQSAAGQHAPPADYPWQFSIQFQSNVTTADAVAGNREGATVNSMYYDWSLRMQRVDHGASSFECAHFYYSTAPCTIWFTPTGLFRQLQAPVPAGQPECCLDMPEIQASPPDWARSIEPPATFLTVDTDSYSGMYSAHWAFATADPNPVRPPHEYRQVEEGDEMDGRPLTFTFPVAEGRQDYHFDPTSLMVGRPDPALFELPRACFLDSDPAAPLMCPQPASSRRE